VSCARGSLDYTQASTEQARASNASQPTYTSSTERGKTCPTRASNASHSAPSGGSTKDSRTFITALSCERSSNDSPPAPPERVVPLEHASVDTDRLDHTRFDLTRRLDHPRTPAARQARLALITAVRELRPQLRGPRPSWNSWVERAQAKANAGGSSWRLGRAPPKVRSHAPTLVLEANVERAVDEFDKEHGRLTRGAVSMRSALEQDVTHMAKHEGMRHQLMNVRRQRLVVPEKALEKVVYAVVPEKKAHVVVMKQWGLWDSIWVPRVKWADAKDFFDTTARSRAAFELDWGRAATRGLAKFILNHDDGESDEDESDDEDEGGVSRDASWVPSWGSDEVAEVAMVMCDNIELINMLFDFYAASGATNIVSQMGLNGFTEFVDNFGLVDQSRPSTKKSAWDQMFITVDSSACKSTEAKLQEVYNQRKMVNRQEFYSAVVRASVMVYVQTKVILDVSSAVQHFIEVNLRPKADPLLFTHANEFRKVIYTEDVDVVLRSHEGALRLLFEGTYKRKQFVMEHGGLANKLASYPNWMEVLYISTQSVCLEP